VVATVATLLVGFLFCRLGIWQLDRADEKRAILENHSTAMQLAPLSKLDGAIEDLLYRQVKLEGRFDQQHQFLIDNRVVGGQPGFEVITPFYLSNDQYVLVNRGWVGHTGDRKVSIDTNPQLTADLTVQGIITTPSQGFAREVGTDSADDQWPLILQYVDYETIAAKLDKIAAIDAVVIAAVDQPGNFVYNWKPVGSGIETHLGYAFQWFAMLTALIALYLYLMVIKKHND